jgi:myo-inositol 2-dehydrogenase/D-chiro-inositol 1-dehydrogenase
VSRRLNRRGFLRAAAGAALCSIVPAHVVAALRRSRRLPSRTITRAVIGTGGMGMNHVWENKPGEPPQTLAVCDVDADHLAQAVKKAGGPVEGYADFRRVLERRDVDVVVVATPPHWHALISIAAMRADKDVFCEKPMTRFWREGVVLAETVRRTGRIFQVNAYGRNGAVRLRRLVASGLLGSPITATLAPRLGHNFKVRQWSGRTDLSAKPVPAALDYDFWLGPAPFKPYHPHRVHGSFRGYWDYDGGGLADMGMHWLDPVVYALGKDGEDPVRVAATAPWPPHPDACGLWGTVRFEYADGTRIVLESEEWGPRDPDPAPFLRGPKGSVRDKDSGETDPPGLLEQASAYPVSARDRSFEDAVRTRDHSDTAKPTVDESQRTMTLIHLANIAIRTGRPLEWDERRGRFIGAPEADRLLDVPLRAPWTL